MSSPGPVSEGARATDSSSVVKPESGSCLLFLHDPGDIFRAGAARAADSLVQTASSWFRSEFQFLEGSGQVV